MLSATFQEENLESCIYAANDVWVRTHKLPRSVGLPSTFMCGRIKMSWNETGRNQATCS